MRTNLILHLHCSECGKILRLCYPKECKTQPVSPQFGEEDYKPTGAACYYPDKISVEPYRNCIEKYTVPAKNIIDAIRAVQEIDK